MYICILNFNLHVSSCLFLRRFPEKGATCEYLFQINCAQNFPPVCMRIQVLKQRMRMHFSVGMVSCKQALAKLERMTERSARASALMLCYRAFCIYISLCKWRSSLTTQDLRQRLPISSSNAIRIRDHKDMGQECIGPSRFSMSFQPSLEKRYALRVFKACLAGEFCPVKRSNKPEGLSVT